MDENLFKYAPLRQKRRSGFDKSFSNFLTAKVGTLVPVFCDEVIPNTDVNVRVAAQATLPPLASDVFMRCDLKMEAFFVPSRLLYGGYSDWLVGNTVDFNGVESQVALPFVQIQGNRLAWLQPGTLADYLGYKNRGVSVDNLDNPVKKLNIFPFLCYHRCFDDWYRNTLVQKRLFKRPTTVGGSGPGFLPYIWLKEGDSVGYDLYSNVFMDGTRLGELHQRNYGMDYFTAATPLPQKGDAQKVTFEIPESGDGSFTIAALRANNAMQMFLERNNLLGERLQDYVAGHYGAHMPDSVAQRAVLLGSASFDIYSKGVETTSSNMVNPGTPGTALKSANPFSAIAGNIVGSARADGSDFIIRNFKAQEPGYIMIIASIVPQANYSTGIDRMLLRYTSTGSQTDLANPLLEGVGPQPIYSSEILADANRDDVFGYIDRYADFKTKLNQTHGLFVDGQSLQSFVLQRPFVSAETEQPQLNSGFLAIQPSDMDNVTAVSSLLSQYGAMIDCYFDYKAVMPLARYSVPSLESPMDGDFEVVQRSGSKID